MKMKKLLQGAIFAAAFTITGIAAGIVSASAETVDLGTGKIGVDMQTQKLTYTAADSTVIASQGQFDKEILVWMGAKSTVSIEGAKKSALKPTVWDTYDVQGGTKYGEKIEIDLSKLVNTKDNYIVIKAIKGDGTESEPVVISIPAVDKYTGATFEPSLAELSVAVGTSKRDAIDTKDYQFRTAYSLWKESSDAVEGEFKNLQKQGATVYVRTTGVVDAITGTSDEEIYDAVTKTPVKYTKVMKSAPLPGKEAKVNIAKEANGPAVKVSYATAEATLAKGVEYRVISNVKSATKVEATITKNAVNEGTKPEVVSVASLLAENADTGFLEVRTAAVAAKKCASKWTRVALQLPVGLGDALTPGKTAKAKPTEENKTDKEITWGGAGVAEAKIEADGEEGKKVAVVTAKYTSKTDKNGVVTITGVELTNASDDAYQVIVVPAGKTVAEIAADKKQVKALAAQKVTKNETKAAVLALPIKTTLEGSSIYIRKAGVDKTQTWVGVYEEFGLVDYPKSEPNEGYEEPENKEEGN